MSGAPARLYSDLQRGICSSSGDRRIAESATLLIDEVFPKQPVRQWALSIPYPLRFLFASHPEIMGRVLGVVYRWLNWQPRRPLASIRVCAGYAAYNFCTLILADVWRATQRS